MKKKGFKALTLAMMLTIGATAMRYLNYKGEMAISTWVDDEYYVDANGIMVNNQWVKTKPQYETDAEDVWFYFGSSGKAAKDGWKKIDGKNYLFDGDGVMMTGWQEIDGNKYYFDQYGKAVTGWKENHGNKNYFDANGKMATGWETIDGNRYYFNERGVAVTGLKEIGGRKYFFGWDGKATTGWQTIDGIKYYFDQRSEISGERCYYRTFAGCPFGRIEEI